MIFIAGDDTQTEADTPDNVALIPDGSKEGTSSSRTPAPKDDTGESHTLHMHEIYYVT